MDFYPRVSIIIPVYNGSNYLHEAIDSALSQSYKNIEIIVVNDGSSDGGKTEEIAHSYGVRIRYFYKVNGGVASALNLGIREMTGEYFSWLSHDDVYYPDKIEVQVNSLHNIKKISILYSDYDFIDSGSRFIRSCKIKPVKPNKFRYALITSTPVNGCTTLIPKACFDEAGIFNEDWPTTQDYELWMRMAKKFEFRHIPKSLVKTRLHAEQGAHTIVTHDDEVNNLYIKYLNEFSIDDFMTMTGEKSAASFYAKLAINFKKREYETASLYALDLSRRYLCNNRTFLFMKSRILISYCRFWNRKFRLAYWVSLIKKVLKIKGKLV